MMGSRPSEWLSQQLDNCKDVLLLDCRPPNDYNVSHIQGAIHVAIPTLLQRRLKKGNLAVSSVISCAEGKEKFDSKWRKEVLIVYDECTSDMNSNSTSVVGLLLKRLQEDGCRVYLLQGGFASFKEKYPHHCAGLKEGSSPEDSAIFGLRNLQLTDTTESGQPDEETPNSAVVFPVKVLPNLFLGNAKNASDLECLEKNGIKYILNVTVDVPNTFENDPNFKYIQIPISDHWSQNLSTFFQKAIAFIEEGRAKNCGVLVHCLAGISRSVTVTVAYLMYSRSLSLNDAYDFVKTVKPNISPNFNFLGQLQDFERALSHQRQTTGECECKDRSSPDSASGSPCHCSSPKYYFSSPTNCTPTQKFATTPS